MSDRAEIHGGVEREITLAICSDSPELVADQIAGLASIAGYCLIPRDACTIRDVYFDTSDRILGNHRWSLRIREMGRDRLIAVKGPGTLMDWGGVERTELELPWSQEAFKDALNMVSRLSSSHVSYGPHCDLSDPLSVLASVGLSPIQRRTTARRPREIRVDPTTPILAELVIDIVQYEFAAMTIFHDEIEIEAESYDATKVIERVASALLEAYGNALLPWKHGKLAFGLVVEELLAGEESGGLIRKGRFTREAYEKIHSAELPAKR